MLRGKTQALRAFEPLTPEVYAEPATTQYLDAFAKLEAGDPAAAGAFASLMGVRPDDRLVNFHLKRLLNGETGTLVASI